MSFKDDFTEEQWIHVIAAPLVAGLAVTAADPSGLVGAVQESAALAGSLKSAGEGASAGSLVAEVIEAYTTGDGRKSARDDTMALIKGRKPAEACEAAVARLGETAALVAATAPGEADDFRRFIRETAQRVAEAGTEGGFLGFGGEKVSDAERKTLADIDAALGGMS
jgi:hypothetical protein